MVGSDVSPTVSSLLCGEDGACLDSTDIATGFDIFGIKETEMGVLEKDDEYEDYGAASYDGGHDLYIETLVSKEMSFVQRFRGDSSPEFDDWFNCARNEAIRWILKTRAMFGFSFLTAYLSVTYLDRFFLKRTTECRQSWAIQLLSVACLSLAAKLEECNVPLLSEFQSSQYCFDNNTIQRTELLILSTLGWRMRSVTPFPYLNYMVSKLRSYLQPKDLVFKATQVIFWAIEKMNLVDYRPSTIATAAIFAASGKELTKALLESEMGVISVDIEHVISCHNLLQEMMKTKKPKLGNIFESEDLSLSNNLRSTHSSVENLNKTVTSTIIGNKRTRSGFDV